MLEKKKGDFYPWSLSAGLIGASYLAQICHELNIDFELAIFNRGFVSDENETETNYLSRKMSVSSMLNNFEMTSVIVSGDVHINLLRNLGSKGKIWVEKKIKRSRFFFSLGQKVYHK